MENIETNITQEDDNKEISDDKNLDNYNSDEINHIKDKLSLYENEIAQLRAANKQKDELLSLYDREKNILEKEKCALKKEAERATKEKENVVMVYATKEKTLLDIKKEKENLEKLLIDSKKEIKNLSSKYQLINDEKTRLTNMFDEKCNEIKKMQKDVEKYKSDISNLEMKLKWNSIKLNQETESKLAAEKKLNDILLEKNEHLTEEKLSEQQKIEKEANLILLKHEHDKKEKEFEALDKEYKILSAKYKDIQEKYQIEQEEKNKLSIELDKEKVQHNEVQNALSQELLNSAKLRSQLEDLRILQAQNVMHKEEISNLTEINNNLNQKIEDFKAEITQIREKELDFLNINKEMTEKIVELQNELFLQASKMKAIEAENEILQKEKQEFDTKYNKISSLLDDEISKKNEERILLTKHLSEKTKLYESTKKKLDNALGDLEAVKNKHSQVIKELNREISKFKKQCDRQSANNKMEDIEQIEPISIPIQSDSESEISNTVAISTLQEPSKKHLVDRILRLQQAATRQTEKIDFLENHTMSLVSELQKKSKVLQYYMLRDQAGALTSSKSDQNKSELSKYGGVMSAIYGGIKGNNQSMTLDLSLEINRKLQAVLEDTLLKNITLKENLDVLGLEVDRLTRQLAQKDITRT